MIYRNLNMNLVFGELFLNWFCFVGTDSARNSHLYCMASLQSQACWSTCSMMKFKNMLLRPLVIPSKSMCLCHADLLTPYRSSGTLSTSCFHLSILTSSGH